MVRTGKRDTGRGNSVLQVIEHPSGRRIIYNLCIRDPRTFCFDPTLGSGREGRSFVKEGRDPCGVPSGGPIGPVNNHLPISCQQIYKTTYPTSSYLRLLKNFV